MNITQFGLSASSGLSAVSGTSCPVKEGRGPYAGLIATPLDYIEA